MTFRLLNRVRMSVSGTAGTGDLSLNLAAAGFQDLATGGMTDGDTTPYVIEDGSPTGTVWEIGLGTYHSNGTFSRTTVTQSSAGGTTKISATSAAILSATIRAEDLVAAAGFPGSTAPVVVQHDYTTHTDSFGFTSITLGATPTPGNLLIAIGNCSASSGAQGFNWTAADNQYDQNSTTAYKVGYGVRTVQSGDSATISFGSNGGAPSGDYFNGLVLEISGANLALLTKSEGALSSGSTTVQASNPANVLSVFFAGGDGAANPSITAPGSFQVSYFSSGATALKAGWNTVTSAGNAGVTGSVASGTARALVLNIPGV